MSSFKLNEDCELHFWEGVVVVRVNVLRDPPVWPSGKTIGW